MEPLVGSKRPRSDGQPGQAQAPPRPVSIDSLRQGLVTHLGLRTMPGTEPVPDDGVKRQKTAEEDQDPQARHLFAATHQLAADMVKFITAPNSNSESNAETYNLGVGLMTVCATGLPAQQPGHAAVVALVARTMPQYATDVVNHVKEQVKKVLSQNNPAIPEPHLRLALRFLTCLAHVGVVDAPSLVQLVTRIVTTATEAMPLAIQANTGSKTAIRKALDHRVYACAATLPWMPPTQDTAAFRAAIDAYMQVRTSVPTPEAFICARHDPQAVDEDYLAQFLSVVDTPAPGLIPTPYAECAEDIEASTFEPIVLTLDTDMAPATLAALWAAASSTTVHHLRPYFVLQGNQQDGEEEQEEKTETPLRHFVVGDYVSDTLWLLEDVRAERTKYLLRLPLIGTYHEGASQLIVEAIFANMLVMPRPTLSFPYFGTVLSDLFRADPQAFMAVVGVTIKELFDRIPMLSVAVADRLTLWFSFHLSNFSWYFPWSRAFGVVLQQEETHPQRIFVRSVLMRCVRLSYHDNIAAQLDKEGKEFVPLLPPKPEPVFGYAKVASNSGEGDLVALCRRTPARLALAQSLLSEMENRADGDKIRAWFTTRVKDDDIEEDEDRLGVYLDLLVPCVLHRGHKSFSHTSAMLDLYAPLLKEVCQTEADLSVPVAAGEVVPDEARRQRLFDLVAAFWTHSSQHRLVVTDMLLTRDLVSETNVTTWVAAAGSLHEPWIWEVLADVARHVLRETKTVDEAQQEAATARRTTFFVDAFRAGCEALQAVEDASSTLDATLRGRLEQFALEFEEELRPLWTAVMSELGGFEQRVAGVFVPLQSL